MEPPFPSPFLFFTNEWYTVLINHDFKTSFGLILNDLFTCWKFGFIFNPRLKWPPISCSWAYPLCILVFYGELVKPSSLNQISPTPLNKTPALLNSPSNVFEIDNHPGGGRGGGGLTGDLRYMKETMQPKCLQGTKRCIRRDLLLNQRIIIF